MYEMHRPGMNASLFLWLAALLASALPHPTAADFEFSFAPTLQVTLGGVIFYNGNLDDPFVPPLPTTVRTSDFSSNTHTWTFEQLIAPLLENTAVPVERGIYLVARMDPLTLRIEGGTAIRGENYDFVHAAWGIDSPETVQASLSLSPLGDPSTPSGTYLLWFVRLPEYKFVYDPSTDTVTASPFNDADIGKLLEDDPHFFVEASYSYPVEIEFIADVPIPSNPDPVVIIPGILGSEQHNGEWIIDPILHTYDDLIATLDANGYTREVDLFPFPYDWRKSNVETAVLLKEKIDDVKAICSCSKVDLVAHSMGGLVARQYIQSDAYEGDVDQLIFLGTPHLGAPKAYLMWEGGEVSAFNDLFDELLELLLEHEAHEEGYENLFQYIQVRPINSVKELLPIYDYIFDDGDLRSYPDNYPRNVFLENLKAGLPKLSNSSVRTYNIAGQIETQETINGLQVVENAQLAPMWEHGYPVDFFNPFGDHGLILGGGDKTVPFASASFVSDHSEIVPYIHSALPLETQAFVFKVLTGRDPESISRVFAGLDIANLLIFKILSPADMLIVDPGGKKSGKDLNGQEINEIVNAFYTGFSADTEFITILNPLDGEYKVYTQGTGSGSYTVEASFIGNATTTDASFTGNTAPGITSQLNLEVDDGGLPPESLEIVVTYESTLADLEQIYQLKWINIGIYKSLKAQLQKAKKAPAVVAEALLQNMLKQLNAYRGRLLNEQGYQILKADIEKLVKL